MQFVPTTAIALVAMLAIVRLGPCRGLWVFFAVTPIGVAAAFNLPALGGASIVLADMAALTMFGVLMFEREAVGRMLATMRPFTPGFFLVVLFVFATYATMFYPRLFAGQIEVFGIARTANQVGIVSIPLKPTNGNITQLSRFSLGVMIFLTLATAFRRSPAPDMIVRAMVTNVVVHVSLGFLEVTSFNLGLPSLFDWIRTANYAMATNQVMAGLKRMAGGFPEASAFGYHTMGLFGFWLQYWFSRGRFRYSGWMVLLVLAVLVLSTSSSAYVGAAFFLLIFVMANSGQVLVRDVDTRVAAIVGGLAVLLLVVMSSLAVAYGTLPGVTAYLDRVLIDKLGSNSGVERMSWNVQAFENFLDTGTIGAGLGSIRASNWLISVLASLGAIGALIYLLFLVSVFLTHQPSLGSETAIVMRALKIGCLALLCRALITKSTPNLELTFFAMAGLVAGLSTSAPLSRSGDDREVVPTAYQPAGARERDEKG